ncbi:hypothetical protein PCASD_22993 [Puccinia coronata f. sp. avenae]|uniref:Uncharacterized protein n=1 Tax=Puccinia coronata f. sp. avenae TaxID=200324 RepID=A0A2N5TQA1_9BASI|nr:hypothetical protein PCASD_22993 [Puccinia coronata f. sp. avenae]
MPHAYKWREDGRLGVRPRRTGVLAMHGCLEGVQALHALRTGLRGWHACPARLTKPLESRGLRLHALQTGVHGQHACPAGPHAEPAVLTPFPPPQKPISWQQRNPTAFPNGYSPYCPIVVAPNFLPYGSPYPIPNFTQPHQIPTPPNKQLSPTPPTNPQGRPYESYKPSYPRQRPDVTTKNVEVGNIKDEIAELQLHGKVTADAVSARPEIITDTGVGTMSFPGKNGMTVSVKGMMYCEQASSTLISPAALRRANVRIAYDSTAQTIVSDGYIRGYVGRFEPMLHCRNISLVWLDATLALVDTTPVLLDANTLLVDIVLVIVDAIPAILDAILVCLTGLWHFGLPQPAHRVLAQLPPGQPPHLVLFGCVTLATSLSHSIPLLTGLQEAIVTNILPELPPPLEIVPTTFLAGPAPRLREAFLLKQDSCFFSTLPSNLLTEVDALKERIVRQQHTV